MGFVIRLLSMNTKESFAFFSHWKVHSQIGLLRMEDSEYFSAKRGKRMFYIWFWVRPTFTKQRRK